MNSTTKPLISVIVTAHAEGTLLHHTLLSIIAAAEVLPKHAPVEIILHADNPTKATSEYLLRVSSFIPESVTLTVFQNSFGNPGASRNFCVSKAKGRYVTFIDGDDLMGSTWLNNAYCLLESSDEPLVAHSEYTIEFGDTNSIVKKYASIDKPVDALLSVWAGRWNAIIFTHKSLIDKVGYPEATNGYGFEDWELSCKIIAEGVKNSLVPETVMFVRRKSSNSVWSEHASEYAVLRKNGCLDFSYIRSIEEPALVQQRSQQQSTIAQLNRLKSSKSLPARALKKAYRTIISRKNSIENPPVLPGWLIEQWTTIHQYDRRIFPTDSLIAHPSYYHSLTDDSYWVGHAYKKLIDQTSYDSYDYLLFVPWLISGGADLYAINFINELQRQHPKKRFAVIATMPHIENPSKPSNLLDSIDFISLSPASNRLQPVHINRLLEQFIENSSASTLHIINSLQAFDYAQTHKKYITKTNKKVIATSFSQSVDAHNGRLYGYSHTHVPEIYDVCSLITTDNQAVSDMWVREYGFDTAKIQVIRPVITIKQNTNGTGKINDSTEHRLLWAARLAPEKLVEMVPKIAKELPATITVEMYGTPGGDFNMQSLNNLPSNVVYKGSFTDFYSLPLSTYSAYLYTSLFDGMPNALVEATSAGLPIVASDAGGIGEFINNDTGIIVKNIFDAREYADAIEKIVNNPDLASSLNHAALNLLGKDYTASIFTEAVKTFSKQTNL